MAINEEWVQLVDADNRPIGGTPRSEMRSKALRYRASYIFVFNCNEELFVQQRAHSKDKYPGIFVLAMRSLLNKQFLIAVENKDITGPITKGFAPHLTARGASDRSIICIDKLNPLFVYSH